MYVSFIDPPILMLLKKDEFAVVTRAASSRGLGVPRVSRYERELDISDVPQAWRTQG